MNNRPQYWMNRDTGELLTIREALHQWRTEYDGDDETNLLAFSDQYTPIY